MDRPDQVGYHHGMLHPGRRSGEKRHPRPIDPLRLCWTAIPLVGEPYSRAVCVPVLAIHPRIKARLPYRVGTKATYSALKDLFVLRCRRCCRNASRDQCPLPNLRSCIALRHPVHLDRLLRALHEAFLVLARGWVACTKRWRVAASRHFGFSENFGKHLCLFGTIPNQMRQRGASCRHDVMMTAHTSAFLIQTYIQTDTHTYIR